jgi:hypothetical protein
MLLLLSLAAALNVRAYTVSSTEEAALPNASRNDYDFDYEFPYEYDLHYDLPLENGNTIDTDTDTYTYTPTPTRSFWDVYDDMYKYSSRVQTIDNDAQLHGILMQMRALTRSYLDILYYTYLHVPPLTSEE